MPLLCCGAGDMLVVVGDMDLRVAVLCVVNCGLTFLSLKVREYIAFSFGRGTLCSP